MLIYSPEEIFSSSYKPLWILFELLELGYEFFWPIELLSHNSSCPQFDPASESIYPKFLDWLLKCYELIEGFYPLNWF